MSQSKIAGLLFVVAAALMVFSQCKRDKANPFRNTQTYHDYVNFKRLSRVEQVKACGKCHQQIYGNEMNGPHANAYKNLLAHTAFVNGSDYDCKPYCQHVNDVLPNCTKCHTGGNLFETAFKNVTGQQIIEAIKQNPEKAFEEFGAVKRDSLTLITGVDCITCHYNGKNTVTTMDFVKVPAKTNCPDFCSPQKSALFTSNMNCFPCHQEQVVTMQGYPAQAASCNSCHGEKDSKGKLTHYTYWAHNPADKVIPTQLNIFEGIEATYANGRSDIKVVWNNKTLPHMRSVCTELFAVVNVTKNKLLLKSDTIRINRKEEHDKQLTTWFKNIPVPGSGGTEFKQLNDSIVRFIPLPATAQGGNIEVNVTGYKKEQYWLSDSIHAVYLRKTIQLH